MLRQLDKEGFEKEVLDAAGKVGVLFHAHWAMPSVYQFVNMEQYPIFHVDIDETPEVGAILNLRALPALYIFNAGELQSYKIGYMEQDKIEEYLKQEGILV
jgi:thioredoxin-like negative regulator of GroEL